MKLLTLLALTLSLTVNAADTAESTFKRDSHLPAELQAKVLAAVQAKCSKALFGFREADTVVTEKSFDQGQRDYTYRTFLTATYYFDGMHPVGADIVVESAEYAISNPSIERTEVLSVKSFSTGICE